eukprot:jgi/Mesvir1/7388/Mv19189-RA.1
MYDIFGKYGAIRQIRIGNSKETRGTAFVVYEDIYDAKEAVDHLSGFNVANRYPCHQKDFDAFDAFFITFSYWNVASHGHLCFLAMTLQAKMSKKLDQKKKEEELTKLQKKYGVSADD